MSFTTIPWVTEPMFNCEWPDCEKAGYAFGFAGCLDGHIVEAILCDPHFNQWVPMIRNSFCLCGLKIDQIDAISTRMIHFSWVADLIRDQSARKVVDVLKQAGLPTGGWVAPIPQGLQPLTSPKGFRNMEDLHSYYKYKQDRGERG